tara:strand:- start:64 stop:444 length:381 start_codon:yes stop_codon:yes gene_type:complete
MTQLTQEQIDAQDYHDYLKNKSEKELSEYEKNMRRSFYESEALDSLRNTNYYLIIMYYTLLIGYLGIILFKIFFRNKTFTEYTWEFAKMFILLLYPYFMRFFFITLIVSLVSMIWRNIPKNYYVFF